MQMLPYARQQVSAAASELRTTRLLVHDDGPELAVVPDEDDLLDAQRQGDEALRLCRLRRLVHQHLRAG